MPIRFRCAYCNQLMGIARRKAGTVVRCPTCSGQVVVPDPEVAGPEAEEPSPPGPQPKGPELFDRSDFGDDLFHNAQPSVARGGAGRGGGFLPVPQQPQAPAAPPGGYDVSPALPPSGASYLGPAPAPPGILLTPGKLAVVAVFVVLLIGVACFAGLLFGRACVAVRAGFECVRNDKRG
jgi:DNA-directed RNA polymerase subunit RPC12/RpoP